MTAHAFLFTLAAIGISETVYLIRKRLAREKPICIIGEDCTKVLQSNYKTIFLGIPNDVLGLLFYIGVSAITVFLVLEIQPMGLWQKLANIFIPLGAVASIFFIYLQWKVIKSWCFLCLLSAATMFTMTAIIIFSDLTLLT